MKIPDNNILAPAGVRGGAPYTWGCLVCLGVGAGEWEGNLLLGFSLIQDQEAGIYLCH